MLYSKSINSNNNFPVIRQPTLPPVTELHAQKAWIDWKSYIPLSFMHWGRAKMMVNKKKAAEAAVLHHDLCTLCSSTPVKQTCHISFSKLFLFSLSGDCTLHISTEEYSLIDEIVMFMLVSTMYLLCRPENVQVYIPECSSMSGFWSRRDPSPIRSRSWSSSAWPSHRLKVCLVFVSYLKMTVGSLDEVKVQVKEKFWRLCGAMHGMDSARPSSCVISEIYHIRLFVRNLPLHEICHYVTKTHLVFSETQSTPGSCQLI